MAFDASPSWSGFNYQGKVALYHTLKIINEHPVDTDHSGRNLMLENIEDFEILNAGVYQSLHQVKAYNSASYSNYSNALLEITLALYKKHDSKGFIHTWKKIGFKKSFTTLIDSIKDDLCMLLSQYEPMPRNGKSLIEKAVSGDSGIPKVASILREALSNKTADEIYSIIDSIYNGTNNALARLETYLYDDGNDFCDLDSIGVKIKNEIKFFLESRGRATTDVQTDRTFHYLLGMIDEYVIKRHEQKQEDEKISIPFSNVIQLILEDRENMSKRYLAFKFKNYFSSKIDEFIADEDDYKSPSEDKACNLIVARDYLLSLTAMDLWSYYRSFSPHTYLEHASNIENAFDVDGQGIRNVLTKIFYLIDHTRAVHDIERHKFTYRISAAPEGNYLPTTIFDITSPEKIAKQIIKNPGVNELLYEVGNVIYHGNKYHQFSPVLSSNAEAPVEVGDDPRGKQNETLRIINLVPISIAKDSLL